MRSASRRAIALVIIILGVLGVLASAAAAQSVHLAPATAPSSGRVAPQGEPGQALHVSGVVVGPDDRPISGASLYIYQTDHEGYYGVKPASDNRNPRLKLFLRSIKPGSYPNGRVPAHIHFEVGADGRSANVFEIVFEGDPFVTAEMRGNPAFSVRPIAGGQVTERIVLK